MKTFTGNLNPCSDCGNLVSKTAVSCPKCGRKLKIRATSALAGIILLWLIVCVIFGLAYGLINALDQSMRQPSASELIR